MKKNILVLAPHDLVLDPRVKWMSDSLLKMFNVTAVGIKQVERNPTFDADVVIKELQASPIKISSVAKVALKTFPASFFPWAVIFCLFGIVLLPLAAVFKVSKKIFSKFPQLHSRFSSFKGTFLFKLLMDIHFIFYLAKHFMMVTCTFKKYFDEDSLKYEYVVANDLDSVIPALYLKKMTGCKVLYDAHEFFPFQFTDTTKLMPWVLAKLEKSLLPGIDTMMTVTPQLAEAIRREYNLAEEIVVIPNCAPLEKSLRQNNKPERDKKVFLFLGNFSKGRGIEKLIKHWAALKIDNAVLVLRGPECLFKSQCKELAQSLGALGNSIIFEAPVTEDELIETASQADVGVIPYDAVSINNLNCCPNKLSQYLQSGIAVLANDLPFVTDIINKSQAGLTFNINDSESFGKAVRSLVSDDSKLLEKKANAYQYARSEYNWDKVSSPVFKKIFV